MQNSSNNGVKQYQCEQCSKTFSMKYNLNRHVKEHNQEKKYQCKSCGKLFSRKEHLDRHSKSNCDNKYSK